VDRLNIVAHDRFQEIIDEANRSDSPIRLQAVVIDPADIAQKTVTVVSQSRLDNLLGVTPDNATAGTLVAGVDTARAFPDPADQKVAQLTREVIRTLESQPKRLPALGHLSKPEIQKEIVAAVTELYQMPQMELEGISRQPDIAAVVARTHRAGGATDHRYPSNSGGPEGRGEVRLQAVSAKARRLAVRAGVRGPLGADAADRRGCCRRPWSCGRG
jgi:hypothetical protein